MRFHIKRALSNLPILSESIKTHSLAALGDYSSSCQLIEIKQTNMPTPIEIIRDKEKEFDEKFIDVMGLETDPDGRKNMYLIRDQDDVVQHGIDFDDERKELKSHIRSTLIALIKSQIEQVEGRKVCEKFESDGEKHSCIESCEGIVENCRICHRDRCSNTVCPLGKGVDNNSVYNSALTTIITDMKALLAELER